MKIEGPDRSQQTSGPRKKGKAGASGDSSFADMVMGTPGGASGAGATHSIARVDVLLAAQATEDPTERAARKRARERGGKLLDELEKLRAGLLTGSLTVGHLVDIADVVASHREKIMDPRLTAVLDEIDLRAQVELAKLRVALDNN
jgi:hypothetical protein